MTESERFDLGAWLGLRMEAVAFDSAPRAERWASRLADCGVPVVIHPRYPHVAVRVGWSVHAPYGAVRSRVGRNEQ